MTNLKKIGALAVAVASLAACGSTSASAGASPTVVPQRTVTVFAASSLTGLFTDLAKQYETSHPGLTVTLSFGSSTTLARQIAEGAPANVFASASTTAMAAAGARVGDARNYVTNHVVVAQPASDLIPVNGGAGVLNHVRTWIQCAHETPCGAAADRAVAAFGVTSKPASLEPDVKSVVAKLLAGEADAGIIYITDARAAGTKLTAGEFGAYAPGSPEAKALSTQYMIGQVDSGNADAAGFIEFALSAFAMSIATDLGFTPPA